MATNKPKKTANKSKNKSTKTAVKSEKTEKPAVVAAEKKVENEKVEKPEVKTEEKKVEEKKECTFFKTFFAKKCDSKENILTIFHDKKLYGALIGEVVGTLLLSIVLLTLGAYQPLYMFFIVIGIVLMTFGLSGSHLNPLITAGMMATRRVSAIRGVLYILAQILGAWFGYLIVNAFFSAGAMTTELPAMAPVANEMFWIVTMVEFFGSILIGFAFARALQYKRSALTFATVVAGGVTIAFIAVIVISSTFLELSSNFMMNPAVALMYQILPTGGDNVADLLASIALALLTYVIFPVAGGIIGFFVSDAASVLKEEKLEM